MAENTELKKINVELGRRTAVWDPGVEGFAGLSAIDPTKSSTAEFDSTKQPKLFKLAITAVRLNVLNEIEKGEKKTKKTEVTEVIKNDELPTMQKRAEQLMTDLNQENMLEIIEKEKDIGMIESLLELEIAKKNNSNKMRKKVYDALKEKMEKLDEPAL